MEDDPAAAKRLLDSGKFDIKDPNVDKGAALRWAAEYGHLDAIKLLVGMGADVTSKGPEDGSTALHLASHFNSLTIIKYLIEHVGGIDIEERDTQGRTVLATAAEYGRPEIVRYYLDECAAVLYTCDNYGTTPLHYASLFGQGSTIELLLSEGVELEAEDGRGRTALCLAAVTARPQIIELLLEKGGDLHTTDGQGWTALHHATRKNIRVMVNLLLDKGLDVDTKNEEGQTPLAIAAEWGLKDIVVLLLDRDADVTAVDEYLRTPLHFAAQYDHLATVECLLERGADRAAVTDLGHTALDLAETEENWAVVELLQGMVPKKMQKKKRAELFLSAAQAGRVSEVRRLLEEGVDKDAIDVNRRSALSLAAEKGHLAIVDVLLEQECKVSLRDDSEQAPLWWAARFGHVEVVQRLLVRGISVDAADHMGQTPLSAAAQKGHEAVVQLLLEERADMDSKVTYGKTALIFAAGNGHLSIVEMLLEKGADMDCSAKNGETAMALAMKNGHRAVEELLRSAAAAKAPLSTDSSGDNNDDEEEEDEDEDEDEEGKEEEKEEQDGDADKAEEDRNIEEEEDLADSDEDDVDAIRADVDATGADNHNDGSRTQAEKLTKALLIAAKKGRVAAVKRHLRVGTKIECRDDDGRTPLILAAEDGQLAVVKLLLDAGANVEACNKSKETALGRAVVGGQLESIRLLLDAGAKMEARNKKNGNGNKNGNKNGNGQAPLLYAAELGRHGPLELLIERGANIEAKSKHGRTALGEAVFHGNEECVKILLQHHAKLECIDRAGQTPLSTAVGKGLATVVRLLLEVGAKMKAAAHGKSPLCIAAESGYEAMLQPLVDNGANVEHRSDGGRTPLMLAAQAGRGMVVKLLIEMGAQTDARDDEGRTAQSLAKESGHDAVAKLLMQAAVIRKRWKQARKKTQPGGRPGDYYQYEAMSGENCIRLLELHPGTDDDMISFELHEVNLPDLSLGDGPVYEALSYEWRDKVGSIPVQCGTRRLLVTPNLKAALRRLRQKEGTRTLWIDALCINQDDLNERASQVSLMARLYREARTVNMWLGDETEKTAAAAVHLPALVKAYDLIMRANPQGTVFATVTFDERSGYKDTLLPLLKPIMDDQDALDGFRDLFHRPYFTRAWILQEIILAKRGNVLCGPHGWDWNDFKKAVTAVQNCGAVMGPKLRLNTVMGELLSLTQLYSEFGFLWPQHACMSLREFKSSDPRDKIYAPLGLSPVEKGGKRVTTIVPDYRSSVRDVFVNAARYFIERNQLLSFWGDSNQHTKKRVQGLPTWVPDWTMGTYNSILRTKNNKGHLVKGPLTVAGVGEKRGKEEGEEAVLSLNAYMLDRVVFAVSLTREMDVYDVVGSVAGALARMGRAIFDGRPVATPASAGGKTQSNLEALWHAISWVRASRLAEAGFRGRISVDEVLPYLAWRISTDASLEEGQRKPPPELEGRVREWAAKAADPSTPDFDLDICKRLEDFSQYDIDIMYTEKGFFGVTNIGEAVRDAGKGGSVIGLVATILSTVDEVALLRVKKEKECVKYYEYVDWFHTYHLQKAFKTLEEVEVGASGRVERIEIR